MPESLQKLNELHEKRNRKIMEGRQLLDASEVLSNDDSAKYDQILADVHAIDDTIKREMELRDHERTILEAEQAKRDNAAKPETAEKQKRESIEQWLRSGRPGEHAELRNLQAEGNNAQGGYLVMPEIMAPGFIQAVDDALYLRQMASVFTVAPSQTLSGVSRDTDVDDADWTTELQTGTEDSSLAFGKRSLKPIPFRKRIKLSRDLINSGAIDVVTYVQNRLAYKAGVTEEKGYLTGDGSDRPLGLFTASSDGISTSRDVSTDNTSSAVTFDGLKEAIGSVKQQYRSRSGFGWLGHRDFVTQVSKLTDDQSRYLWEPSTQVGNPDRLLGYPLLESEFAPNTFTTGQYVAILGDMSEYWIAQANQIGLLVLNELYAETNQIGYIIFRAADGMPVLEEAFARVTLA